MVTFTTNKSVGSAHAMLSSLAMQKNAALEFQVRHFHHTPDQKAWKVQIIWNGQTVANSIQSDRKLAIQKASQVAVKNVEKLIQRSQKQKKASNVVEVQEGMKLDSFGRELQEYIDTHPSPPKKCATVSSQTETTDKLSVPSVKGGMSRVESYVEISIAENQPILGPKSSDDSSSTTSSDEDNNKKHSRQRISRFFYR
eukprot:TRINITY_DN15886_c0_g1_i1.p1 TRINITY_DN15886_c0_g1~~TRINITY_DN15886_c0_g1_i1.p1  ORF type:complete len:198 (+),score=27.60 TRINITY_DN15886_c0_g1_i1:84-677(+)